MAWRSVESLKKLRKQIEEKWPGVDKTQFGTIGDERHQATKSDHNPESDGTVDALDIPHQPEIGLDAHRVADILLSSHDRRISYIISNSRIAGDEGYAKRNNTKPWVWGPYNGDNPHDHHIHVSVNDAWQDDTSPWKITEDEVTTGWKSGKCSWYSQYKGKYTWVDEGDEPESNALGVPDYAQGVAFYDRATLGKWFEVQYPNGNIRAEQQTDIGPAPKTGRLIDISAAAAERAGYTPRNFPTDSIVSWREIDVPKQVAGLSPKEQAVAFYKLRETTNLPSTEVHPPEPKTIDEAFQEFQAGQAEWNKWLLEHIKDQKPENTELTELFEEIKPVLMNNKGTLLFIASQLPLSTQAKLFRFGLSGGIPFGVMETSMNEPQTDPKGWLQSKSIWGVGLMLLPTIAKLFGYNVSGDDVNTIIQVGSNIMEGIGAILAVWGRVTATAPLSAAPIVTDKK